MIGSTNATIPSILILDLAAYGYKRRFCDSVDAGGFGDSFRRSLPAIGWSVGPDDIYLVDSIADLCLSSLGRVELRYLHRVLRDDLLAGSNGRRSRIRHFAEDFDGQ